MGGGSSVRRPAARVVIVSERDQVLLSRHVLEEGRSIWAAPGGALQHGESFEQAARRELWEETGLSGKDLGPCVWRRRHVFRFRGALYEAVERYFLLRTQEFEPAPAALEDYEVEDIAESRWWSADEIAAAGGETFAPRRFAALLGPVLAGDIPEAPIDIPEAPINVGT